MQIFFYKSYFISFSQLLSHHSKNMYYIEIVKPKDGVISVFQKSTSSCPKFLKDYKCKHLLCLLYRNVI